MSLGFFKNIVENEISQQPHDYYNDLEQAFIHEQWDNTNVRLSIQEQDMDENYEFPTFTFHETEAWQNYVVGQTSTGMKNGSDFCQLTFESLQHPCIRGRYYLFEDNYWIGDFTDAHDGTVRGMTVRRCNNFLRIIDPKNGAIFSAPCVVDYDMSSPSIQVSHYIITPNNHATVMVQANPDTLRLFKINKRFILGGRPFKLYAYQNAILDDLVSPMPTLLYLDLYLDELHAHDDLEKQLADNGEYDYKVIIENENMDVLQGQQGNLNVKVLLDGNEVDRELVWSTDNANVVNILENGKYNVIGEIGESATISVSLKGNKDIKDSITLTIKEQPVVKAEIIFVPAFDKVRENETIKFEIKAKYNGEEYNPISEISLNPDRVVLSDENVSLKKDGNKYQISCLCRSKFPKILYITVDNEEPSFVVQEERKIQLTSMFG